MSKLDDLLQGVNVEWVDLGNIAKIFSGGTPNTSKAEFYDGDIPWIRSGEVNFNVITTSARNITKQGLSGSSAKLIRKNSVVLAMTGATVGRSAVIQFETSSNQSVAAIETNENIIFYKYLYYILENNYQDMKNAGQGALTSLNLSMIKKFKIQIPCPDNPEKSLEIQQEIVRILDQLTETTNNLKTELENERQIRKKQFEFYREQLFTFGEENANLNKLEDIAIKISSGGTPNTKISEYWDNGTIPWMSSGEVNYGTIYKTEKFITESGLKNSSAKYVPKNSIVIALAGQGKTRGMVARTKIDLTTNQSLGTLTLNEKIVTTDYVYHYLKTQYENLRNISSGNENRGGLNLKMISNYPIPIPSLEEQERIVNLLDQFDAAHTAIEEELTKEIKLRTQQYEYYREKLLTYPKN